MTATTQNAPGTACQRPEGSTTYQTQNRDQENAMTSIPEDTSPVQPSTLVAEWAAWAKAAKPGYSRNTPDPGSTNFPEPGWCEGLLEAADDEVVHSVQAVPADRACSSHAVDVPLSRYRGCDEGTEVIPATASVRLHQRHDERQPTIRVTRRSWRWEPGHLPRGQVLDALTMLPAEARHLARVLAAAADLAEDGDQ